MKKVVIQTEGMTCGGCESKIENKLKKQDGIISVKAVSSKNIVYVSYEEYEIDINTILNIIQKLHYSAKVMEKENKEKISISKLLGIGVLILALYLIIKNTIGFNFIPEVDQSMGYGMLFVVGVITSLHCMAMCGGINLSQCVKYDDGEQKSTKKDKIMPSLLYNIGRVISYTIIGGIVGALGSVLSLGGNATGIISIIAGGFMLIFGIKMLDIFPILRKFNIKMPKFFANKIYAGSKKRGPLFIGLLNGFMPCGPLQTMQLYALGTGSFIAGSTSMLFFALGTLPLMFGLGALSTFISSKFTKNMMKVSAVLVIVLGFTMLSRGFAISGIDFVPETSPVASEGIKKENLPEIKNGVQEVKSTLTSGGKYPNITVIKGIPVKWTITAEKKYINGCNNEIVIPKYNVKKKLTEGDSIIEFVPTETGTVAYSCWMGMIIGKIKVIEEREDVTENIIQEDYSEPIDATGLPSCCGF